MVPPAPMVSTSPTPPVMATLAPPMVMVPEIPVLFQVATRQGSMAGGPAITAGVGGGVGAGGGGGGGSRRRSSGRGVAAGHHQRGCDRRGDAEQATGHVISLYRERRRVRREAWAE